jgi:nicotinate-nucleotide adenylyltransferase
VGPSYTVETLEAFHREYGPRLEIYFITGLESFLEIHTWKDYGKLFKLADFVVINRSGSVPEQLNPYLLDKVANSYKWNSRRQAYVSPNRRPVYFQMVTRLDISSSEIRSRLSRGESIRYLTPDRVRAYILANKLYENKNPKKKGRICG